MHLIEITIYFFIKTDRKINVQDLENKLRENFHYDYCRKLGQLKAIKVFTLTGQPEKEYIQACQNKNQKLGNIKMIALSKESGWKNIFSGYFQESEDNEDSFFSTCWCNAPF